MTPDAPLILEDHNGIHQRIVAQHKGERYVCYTLCIPGTTWGEWRHARPDGTDGACVKRETQLLLDAALQAHRTVNAKASHPARGR